MRILFTDCWVGCYQGEGSYEGGCCPDLLVTNVPDDFDSDDIEEIFDMYLLCLCDGWNNHDKKIYTSKVVKRRSKTWKPVKITDGLDLIYCNEKFVEVDYNDLTNWMGLWSDEEEEEDED
jgi:hypothetical protein